MSGTLESLRRKIDGAGDLEGVVRSMKALAASSIGQYEKAVQSLDDYYRTVELALVACLHQAGAVSLAEGKRPPHERPHEGPYKEKIGAVVFGSDQGLVGRFNEVIVEFAVHELKMLPGKIAKIWAVGDRAHALLADTGDRSSRSAIGSDFRQCHHAPDRSDPDRRPGGSRSGRCWGGLCLPQPPEIRSRLRARRQAAGAAGSRLATTSWPQWHGQQRICRRSSKEPSRRFRLSSEDTSLFCFFRPAPNPLPAKTPAVWRPCNARKRTSKTFWKI